MIAWREAGCVLALLALVVGDSAAAANPPNRLTTLVIVQGACTQLALPPRYDFTRGCLPRLVNEEYQNGRIGFTFTLRNSAIVTFSGAGEQVKPTADLRIQPIDKVIWSLGSGFPTQTITVVGQCRFSNPYKGKATVTCSGTGADGEYRGSFVSDGTPPSGREF